MLHTELPSLPLRARKESVADRIEKLRISELDFWYGQKQALKKINLVIYANEVTAFLGPSGCGKTTLLRCVNRTNEMVADALMNGRITLDGQDIYAVDIDPPMLRQHFGWVAQRPDPFPWSIRSNVLYGPKLWGLYNSRRQADEIVEEALQAVGLWDEVKDQLAKSAVDLSVGQQQRLCVARAIASRPEVILMDEPCSALDPIATTAIEKLILDLRRVYTVVIITHNIQQAARISDRIAFFYLGELVEAGDAEQIILHPRTETCKAFISGNFG